GRACVLLRPGGGDLEIAAAWPPDDRLDTPARAAARWAFERGENAGAGTQTLPNSGWTFLPLAAPDGQVGVLGIERASDGAPLGLEARTLLAALAEQTAAALHRALLSTEVRTARTAAETERVRNILLASISHDFRTPLASVLGSATALIDYEDRLDRDARIDLLGQIRDEARHLDQMVRNLLSMTRLEAGALELNRDWIDVGEALSRIVDLARKRGATQRFDVPGPAAPLLAFVDAGLFDQAIGNVVGNAVRHAGPNATIMLTARSEADGSVVVDIADDGPGVPADLRSHVFEKFTRARRSAADGGESAGLGLAITRGIVEAHGGTVELLPPDPARPAGATFRIRLPARQETPS
uniref:GAF domain-containing sensor histidine kinase n=1 Tax=Aureimonas sp. AU12 TaxID=1638161 RepID=UPI000A76B46A